MHIPSRFHPSRMGLILILGLVSLGLVQGTSAQGPAPRAPSTAAGTAFTYQGQLKSGGSAYTGNCDFQFSLYDAASSGTQIGTTQTASGVTVASGLFTTLIDFGASAVNGEARWLGISVRCPAGSGSYTALSSRQQLTPSPYALYASGNWGLSGNAGSSPLLNFVGTKDNVALMLRVNNVVGWRLGPSGTDTPNVIGGYGGNVIPNTVTGSVIGGGGASGHINNISESYATIGGGISNTASGGVAAIGGGIYNIASGSYATVPGGANNTASGDFSFAAGYHANTNGKTGAFVWGDNSTLTDVLAPANNSFTVRASGGVILYTNPGLTIGTQLPAGSGSWASFSDRNVKANFAQVNAREVLARVVALPIQTWNYQTEEASIRHIGPMAQDFYAAFQVGEDDKHITSIDSEGVALAAIQGLDQQVQEQDAQIAAQQKQIDALDARLTALEQQGRGQPSPLEVNEGLSAPVWMLLGLVGYAVVQRSRRGGTR